MLLALFGGIQLAGILGMIYGPVIMIMFMTTIDIYSQYYASSRDEGSVTIEDGDVAETLPDATAAGVEEAA